MEPMDTMDYNQSMEIIYRFGGGHIVSRLFSSIYQLGVFDILESGPKSCSEIANLVNANPDALYRLMRFFTTQGLFYEDSNNLGIFSKTQISSLFVKEGRFSHLLDLFTFNGHYQLFSTIPETIVSGVEKGSKAMNADNFWDILQKDKHFEKIFTNGMVGFTKTHLPLIIDNCTEFANFDTVADIGGSHGILIKLLLKKYNTIRKGINFDQKSVIELDNSVEEDQRYEKVSGDFLVSVPEADCYILKYILHDWDDEKCKIILNNIHKSMKVGGKIYIFDYVIDPKNYESNSLIMDLMMLHIFTSKERSLQQWEKLFSETNFKIEKIIKEVSTGCLVLTKL